MNRAPAPACRWLAQDIGTIAGFLTPAECDAYVRLSESIGYEEAPVSTAEGMVMIKDLRNNDRVMLDDAARAADLWQRVRPFVPPRFKKKWQPVGVNERLRFYRYGVGQQFDWHHDGAGSFEGFPVSPMTGMALLFHHPIAHKGEPVRRGR